MSTYILKFDAANISPLRYLPTYILLGAIFLVGLTIIWHAKKNCRLIPGRLNIDTRPLSGSD